MIFSLKDNVYFPSLFRTCLLPHPPTLPSSYPSSLSPSFLPSFISSKAKWKNWFCYMTLVIRPHNSENLNTDQNTQFLTSSFNIIRNIFESWSSTVGLYSLVKDALLHPKFSGISVIRVHVEVEYLEVHFSKSVVIEGRQFFSPYQGTFWDTERDFWVSQYEEQGYWSE